jgi:hypothetical protein
LGLCLYALYEGYPLVGSLASMRVSVSPVAVLLEARDANAMSRAGWVASLLPGVSVIFGPWAVLAGVCGAALLFCGWRLTITVTADEVHVVRYVAARLPWRRERFRARPELVVDGWGDWADPEALRLSLDSGAFDLELGWSNSRTGDLAQRLAAEFNRGVSALQR